MDEQNKSVGERWARPAEPAERGYASGERPEDRTGEIRSEIEHTRAEMTETMDAIQDRLRPRNVMSRAAESVRDATVGRAKDMARGAQESWSSRQPYGSGGGFVDRIRENPIPAAFAAGSVAWFAFAAGRSGRPRRRTAIYGSTMGNDPYVRETTIGDEMEESYGEYDAREYDRSSYRDAMSGVGERAGAMTHRAGERMRRASRRTQNGLQRLLSTNPLAVGAIAAAAGAIIGLALPETERENELMGDARESMVDRAKEAAHGAAERVQEAAKAAQKVATEVVTRTDTDRT